MSYTYTMIRISIVLVTFCINSFALYAQYGGRGFGNPYQGSVYMGSNNYPGSYRQPSFMDNNNNRFISTTGAYHYMHRITPTPPTSEPTNSLQRESVDQKCVQSIKHKLIENRYKVVDVFSKSANLYSDSKKKLLKMCDFDSKRRSYIVSPQRIGEVTFQRF